MRRKGVGKRRGSGIPVVSGVVVLAAISILVNSANVLAVPTTYRDEVLSDTPAGYWRLADDSGATAADETANNNGGSYLGGVTRGVLGALPGDPNSAARFDGIDDRVTMGDPAGGIFDFGPSDFSVEAWLKTSVNGDRSVIGKRASNRYWHVEVTDDSSHAGQLRATVRGGSGTRQAYSLVRVDNGAWHHVVVLFDRDAGITFYVDGVPSGFTAAGIGGDLSNSGELQLAKTGNLGSFNGDLDEVAVYRALLTPARIQAHYEASAVDVTAPVVVLSAPADGSSTADVTPAFSGTAGTAIGDSTTVTVQIFAGPDTSGTLVQTLTATRAGTGSYSTDADTLALGTYTARSQQSDAAGNVGLSTANTFTVTEAPPPPPPPPPSDPVLIGAGDIASCDEFAGDDQTAALLDLFPSATVFTAGDNVYISGTAAEFANCYEPSWGRAKSRTRPSPGNHDYDLGNANGYFGYFGAAAGNPAEGYYSYDLGSWHIIALNSNCSSVGGCGLGSAQEAWLRADLAAHPADCTLAYWHHLRFNSGRVHRASVATWVQPFWYALYEYGADVVVSGHEHLYERFLPQNPSGGLDLTYGIPQFTVGTGGFFLYDFGSLRPNSAAQNNTDYGIIKFTLHSGSYDWEFVPIAGGTYTDSG
ncbi:MAG: LamG-like jellyroll fold domain-containing protein, partial [Gaiellaceae bacterium]